MAICDGNDTGANEDLFDQEMEPFYAMIGAAAGADDRFRAASNLLEFIEEKWTTRSDEWQVSACAEVSSLMYQPRFRSAAWLWVERMLNTPQPPIRDSEFFRYMCLVPIVEEPVTWVELVRLLGCCVNDNAARCVLDAYRIADAEERLLEEVRGAFKYFPRLLAELEQVFGSVL